MGIDLGFGSSKFAIVTTEVYESIVRVVYAKEWERPPLDSMVNIAIVQQYIHRCIFA
jgi:hypothetical protein